jgi:pre-mRNA-processing factor SLU7
MAQVSKTAVSRVIALEKDNEPQQRSRDEFKKQKELEEARKLGNAPAAVDEEGRDINPHIPQYISESPWYLDPDGPTLKHQRPQEESVKVYSDITEWYKKGVDKSKVATRYRKGACENCGAVTHKKVDCLERPRKVGAKFTGTNFAPDEFVNPNLSLTFDGKRDRWNGYDNTLHQEVVDQYGAMEEMKKDLKKEKMTKKDVDPTEVGMEKNALLVNRLGRVSVF